MNRYQHEQVQARHRGIGRIRTVTAWVAAGATALAITFGTVFALGQRSAANPGTTPTGGSTGPQVDDQQPADDGGGFQLPAQPPGGSNSRRHHASSGGS